MVRKTLKILLGILLGTAPLCAQQINPGQIKPGTNGYVLTTNSGATIWEALPSNPFQSLTTTGTSGAATLAAGVLNIPQYQCGLTLTTTGSSGAATLSDCTLNIPQYSGGGGSGLNGVLAKATSYTAGSGDNGKLIVFSGTAALTLTLPSPPSSTWAIDLQNTSSQPLSVALPGGVTLDGTSGTRVMNPKMGIWIWTDGTNYFTERGAILTNSSNSPVLVQSNWTACGSEACDISFTDDVTPGDAIVVEYQHSDGGTQLISDTNGDVFPTPNYTNISGNFDITQYVVCSAVGGPTTINNTGVYTIVAVYEISGVAASSCQDGFNSGSATSSAGPVSTGSVTTTVANDFILVTGATRGADASIAFSEANSYTKLIQTGSVVTALNYGSFYGIDASTGSLSDTISVSGESGVLTIYAGILALKPSASSAALIEGDTVAVGPGLNLVGVHAGTNGYVYTSNGPSTMPTWQAPSSAFQSLTTTGTSGASTLSAGVLNIPQYQGALTLTTTGSSGAATLSGGTLNIPEYSGGGGGGGNYTNLGSAVTWAMGSGSGSFASGVFTVGTAGSSITASSIPGSYVDLVVECELRGSASANDVHAQTTFNSDSGADYNDLSIQGNGSSAGAFNNVGANFFIFWDIPAASATANYTGGGDFTVKNYAGTTFYKHASASNGLLFSASGSNIFAYRGEGWWASTAAITSITETASSGNFVAGSTCAIWGKN